RQHTRWPRDWSSDVCSSELTSPRRAKPKSCVPESCEKSAVSKEGSASRHTMAQKSLNANATARSGWKKSRKFIRLSREGQSAPKIGRASCRGRVERLLED